MARSVPNLVFRMPVTLVMVGVLTFCLLSRPPIDAHGETATAEASESSQGQPSTIKTKPFRTVILPKVSFEPQDGGGLKSIVEVVNPSATTPFVGKVLVSTCTPRELSRTLAAWIHSHRNARCFERQMIDMTTVVGAGATEEFSFDFPSFSREALAATHALVTLGDSDSTRDLEGSSALPEEIREKESSVPLTFVPNSAQNGLSYGIINRAYFGDGVVPPEMGISFEPKEEVAGVLFVKNTSGKPQQVVGRFATRARNLFGSEVDRGEIAARQIPVSGEFTRYEFSIPKNDFVPGSYLTSIQLFDAKTGAMSSEIADLRFIVRGPSVSIQEVWWRRNSDGKISAGFQLYGSADRGDAHRPGGALIGEVNGKVILSSAAGEGLTSAIILPFRGDGDGTDGTPISVVTPEALDAESLTLDIQFDQETLRPFNRRWEFELARAPQSAAVDAGIADSESSSSRLEPQNLHRSFEKPTWFAISIFGLLLALALLIVRMKKGESDA